MLVDHQAKDAHHGGTSLVELNSALLQLGLIIEAIPAKVDGSVTEVTNVFSSGDVLHDRGLKDTDEKQKLAQTSGGDGLERGETVGDIGKGGSRVVDIAREADAGFLDEVTDDGEHGNATVLEFDITKAVKLGLVTILDKTEGIEETKRRLGTELILESLQGTGRCLLGGGSERRSGGKEAGENG